MGVKPFPPNVTPPACPGCGQRCDARIPAKAATLLCAACSTVIVIDRDPHGQPVLRLPDTPEWDRLLRLPHIAAGIRDLNRRREQGHRR